MECITKEIQLSLAFAAAVLISAQAHAEDKPSTQLDQLSDFLVKEGACTGNVMAMGKTAAHATTGHAHAEKTLDGNWLVIRYDEDKTAVNPKPFQVAQYLGYDAKNKQFITVLF